MNLMSGLSDLEGSALAKVLRRTVVSALIVGAGAFIVALLVSQPWAGLGIVIGLGLAILNLRFLDSGVAKVQTKGETDRKVLRRAMGTKSVTRLAVITVIAIGLLLLNGPLGIGCVIGLVIFQLVFVLNVGRILVVRVAMNLIAAKQLVLASGNITIGAHHGVVKIAGMTVYLDVVWTTLLAAAIVLTISFLMVRKVTSGVPGKLQLAWETITEQVADLAESAIGPQGRRFVGLGVAVFFFILICNWLAFVPSGDPGFLAPPTGDVNLPLALALIVFVLVHVNSVKARGVKGYFKHYAQPYAALTPINIIEEITKPITMTFRLFGNIFSGVLMISVIVTLIPPYLSWIGLAVWKPFDELFIGAIQAFIFGLLTIMYLGMGMSTEEH